MANNRLFDNLEHMMSTLWTAAGTRALTTPSQRPSVNMPQVVAAAATSTPDPEDRCTKCWHKHKNRECLKQHPELALTSFKSGKGIAVKKIQPMRGNAALAIQSDSSSDEDVHQVNTPPSIGIKTLQVVAHSSNNINVEAFLLDTRSSYHFIKNKALFTSSESANPPVRFSQAVTESKVEKVGKVTVEIGNTTFHVSKAAYSPNSPCNILSAERLWRKN
ncbi:hypothetical protein K470DRAFT_265976 [Piedraia hortae CBS 480.64]|uniref:Retrovirus-related Pol polyprotein from transposon TNT 1-94-like beta-barrel domain-containing protein n=1 Tax=Piedraia hortae CBS 480.64 TaxID=1314780 RepID=A0A6A7BUV4_9PEZI|nr:hypothetical protein K470DRAFT_265976 [Piedraia hortae CBS 480.64]